METRRRRRWLTVLDWIAIAISIITFGIIALLPQSSVTYNPTNPEEYNLETVTVVHPELLQSLAGCGWVSFFALLALAVIAFCRHRYVHTLLLILTAGLGPVAVIATFVLYPAPWQIHNEIRDQDGTCYCFAESSFLQGQQLMLGRMRSETRWTRTYDVLVETAGDSPRSYLRIVRPAGAEEKYGQLYLTEEGWLLGLRSENRCFFAYDLRSNKAHGYGEVEKLSPFLALAPTTELHEPDVADLKSKMGAKVVGVPTDESLRKGLDHPNPHVRSLAAQLVEPKR